MWKSIHGGDASNGTKNCGFVKCNMNVNRGSYIISWENIVGKTKYADNSKFKNVTATYGIL